MADAKIIRRIAVKGQTTPLQIDESDGVMRITGSSGFVPVNGRFFHGSFGTLTGNKLRRALFNYVVRHHGRDS